MLENDKPMEVSVGQTVGGAELVIVPTKMGHYRIESRGAGNPPAITGEMFTNLTLAKRAVEQYRMANAGRIASKKAVIARAERIKAAEELKNGELDKTIQNEE